MMDGTLNSSPSRSRQRGIVSIVAAILLIAVVVFILSQTYGIIGNTSNSNASQGDSVKALFLAESGLERAQAVISKLALAGQLENTSTVINDIQGPENMSFGQGTINIKATVTTDSAASVIVEVEGKIGEAKRTLRRVFSTTPSKGVAGCAKTFSLTMPVKPFTGDGNVGAFTHLTYRAAQDDSCPDTDGSKANAELYDCEVTGGISGATCGVGFVSWDLKGGGTNGLSGIGVSANAKQDASINKLTQTYTVTTRLKKTGGGTPVSVSRLIAQTGALYYPKNRDDFVDFLGYYALDNANKKTAGGNKTPPNNQSFEVNSNWTCQESSGTSTGNRSRAADADLLTYGYGSTGDVVTGVRLGIQPLLNAVTIINDLTSNTKDYSQIWHSYNPRFWPGDGNYATNILPFIGQFGTSEFSGTISSTTNKLTLGIGGLLTGEKLHPNDSIRLAATPAVEVGTLSLPTGNGTAGAEYGISCPVACPNLSGQFIAYSTSLEVSISPGPVIAVGDVITNALGTTTYGTVLSISGTTYTTNAPLLNVPNSPNNMRHVGTWVQLNSPTGMPTASELGTAVAVAAGSGRFTAVGTSAFPVKGNITTSNSTTKESTLESVSGGTLCVGDALFSRDLRLQTWITATPTGTCSSTGPFTVTPEQTIANGISILARTGIAKVDTLNNSFRVSRAPSAPLINPGSLVCGGVCALLFNATGTAIDGLLSFDGDDDSKDWVSGFACVKNVESASIQTFGTLVAKPTSWSEVLR